MDLYNNWNYSASFKQVVNKIEEYPYRRIFYYSQSWVCLRKYYGQALKENLGLALSCQVSSRTTIKNIVENLSNKKSNFPKPVQI